MDAAFCGRRKLLFAFGVAGLFGCGGLVGFHLLLDFFLALGADFSALLTLLLDEFLAAQQLNEACSCAVTLAEALMDDAQVAAVAVAKTRSHGVKQAVH